MLIRRSLILQNFTAGVLILAFILMRNGRGKCVLRRSDTAEKDNIYTLRLMGSHGCFLGALNIYFIRSKLCFHCVFESPFVHQSPRIYARQAFRINSI